MHTSSILKPLGLCWIMTVFALHSLAQASIVPTYACVIAGNPAPYPYTLSGLSWSTSDHWCITGGVISGAGTSCAANDNTPTVGVIWNSGITSGTIAYYQGSNPTPVATLTVAPITNSINAQLSTYDYPNVPSGQEVNISFIGSDLVSQTICSVSYNWATSTNGTTFTVIPNSNTKDFTIDGSFTANTWFERIANLPNGTSTSNVMEIIPSTELSTSTITPAYTAVVAGSTASVTFTATAPTGGLYCGPGPFYSYTWQTSTDNVNWTTVGTSALTFAYSGVVTARTYVRWLSQCGPQVGTANTAIIDVFSPLNPGMITPFSLTISSGGSPGVLTGAPATGGNPGSGGYTYAWYMSTDGTTFSQVGSGLSYSPGTLTAANNYFYRTVSYGTVSPVSSNTIVISTGTPVSYTNSIQTRVLLASGVTTDAAAAALTAVGDVHQTNQYYDGLGRPVQTITRQGSLVTGSNPTDLVHVNEYDAVGRQTINYLPYAATAEADGQFEPQAVIQQNTFNASVFVSDNYYYGQTIYESSSLDRINYMTAPGNSWTGSNRNVQTAFVSNTANDEVRMWWVGNSSTAGTFGVYGSTSSYPAGTLQKNITTDEAGHQVITFKDLAGNIILKKVQNTATADDGTGSDHDGWLCTYYIFDDLNQLRCVIQPQGVVLAQQNSWNLQTLNGIILSDQCFRYEYDQRGRQIMKQVPGAAVVYSVYDNLDRVVMTQDGNLRSQGKWKVTLYESNLDRPVQTGLYTISTTFSAALSSAYGSTAYPFSPPGTPAYPTWELLTKTAYDNYSGLPAPLTGSLQTAPINTTNFLPSGSGSGYAMPVTQQSATTTMGEPTWTEAEVIGSGASQYIVSASIYDEYGRVIQNQTINYSGGEDIVTTQYNFSGLVVLSDERHQLTPASAPIQTYEIATRNTYDVLERPTKIEKQIVASAASPAVSQAWHTVSTTAYDALGRAVTKTIGNNSAGTAALESQALEYNIRGWTLGMNRSSITNAASPNFFGYELGYNNPNTIVAGTTYSTQQYDGNIAGIVWKNAGDEAIRKYDYLYDPASRLAKASFTQYNSAFNTNDGLDFSVDGLQYDANGNILTMNQKGWSGSSSTYIDQLTYTYPCVPNTTTPETNKLQNVIDPLSNSSTVLGDFHYSQAYTTQLGSGGKTTSAIDYSYDANGNLTADKNKDISAITYDYLNQPISIAYSSGKGSIAFTYDAMGNKLAKTVVDNLGNVSGTSTTITTTTTYVSSFVYQSVKYSAQSLSALQYQYQLQFFDQEEGRVRALYTNASSPSTISGFAYDYFLKDHLGNTRCVITEEAEQDVYPTLTFEGTSQSDVAAQNAVWDNGSAQSINVLSNRVTPLPVGFSSSANGTYCGSVATQGSIGATKLLKVMARDVLNVSLEVTYSTATVDNTHANGLSTLASSLASMILNSGQVTNLIENQAGSIASGMRSNGNVVNFFSPESPSSVTTGVPPEAYLHILFFNDQFVFDNVNSIIVPVTTAALNATYAMTRSNITVPRNGYVYVYFSNESNTTVYFDNFALTDIRGPILEDNAYYPFGLTMAGISDKALKSSYAENKFRYNGKELQNQEFSDGSGLEEYDYGARMQDPQLGRFVMIDPLSVVNESLSPYNYTRDNPIRLIDPDGKDANGIFPRLTSVDVGPTGIIFQINQDGDPGVYMTAVPGGPRSLIGYMDPKKKYTIGGQYQYYSKQDYYLKYPLAFVWGMSVPNPQDPNPDQNNIMQAGREAMGATLLVLLFDGDFGEFGEAGGGLSSAEYGNIIGWGQGAVAQTEEGVAITKSLTEHLTSEQVQLWKSQGLTREWIEKQLASYAKAIERGLSQAGKKGANALNNKQLLPRKELLEKILSLWK